jgi:hypothetical protein
MVIPHPPSTGARRIVCAHCGAPFECRLGGGCWCAAEEFRLPMPECAAEDCLCPACLRANALAHHAKPAKAGI